MVRDYVTFYAREYEVRKSVVNPRRVNDPTALVGYIYFLGFTSDSFQDFLLPL